MNVKIAQKYLIHIQNYKLISKHINVNNVENVNAIILPILFVAMKKIVMAQKNFNVNVNKVLKIGNILEDTIKHINVLL